MTGLWLALLFAATIRTDQAPLRRACGEDERVLTRLAAGTQVEVLFALSGTALCYKVQARTVQGEVSGYVLAQDLAGLEEFDRRVSGGKVLNKTTAPAPRLPAPLPGQAARVNEPLLSQASELLASNEPWQALEVLKPLLGKRNPDPDALMLAGVAAWRSDDLRGALNYWRQSLEQQDNPELEDLYRRVEKEMAATKGTTKLYGNRFELRYEGTTVPVELAREMVPVLEREYSRVSAQLGCPTPERIPVIVQSRESYLRTTGAADWSGGQYDGRIHIALVEGNSIGADTRRVFAHEIVHACLANLGRWPAWLHEGLAQKLSGEPADASALAALTVLIQGHAVPKLENLARSWGGMDAAHARLAYRLALMAADALMDYFARDGIAGFLHNPSRLAEVTAELDRRLGL